MSQKIYSNVVAVRLTDKQAREVDRERKKMIQREGVNVSRGEYFRRLHEATKPKPPRKARSS